MKESFVSGLEPNERVTSFFLVQSKEVRFKKQNGEPFLSLRLADRSGQIEAKMWDGVDEIADSFEQDDFIKIRGAVQVFRDQAQIIIHKLRVAAESEVDLADFIPHTDRNIDEMFAELLATIDGFENEDLKRLMREFFDDPETAARFRKAPAAKSMHHGFIGGLLEHVMSLLNLARLVASNYSYLDRDLLQTGVLLHDLGKIFELGYERSFYYTDDGQLLGHITMVVSMVDRKCEQLENFPPKLKVLVQHMLLSHHGRYEFWLTETADVSRGSCAFVHRRSRFEARKHARGTRGNDPRSHLEPVQPGARADGAPQGVLLGGDASRGTGTSRREASSAAGASPDSGL